ncbi:MAG: hypothetical protein U1C74_14440 [Phenylobacterium sp.]|nr:hypothetical protein [Phenylobacterium sp.]
MRKLLVALSLVALATPAAAQSGYGAERSWTLVEKPTAPKSPSAPKAPASPAFKPFKGVSTYERPAGRAPYQASPSPKAPVSSIFGPGKKPR